MSLKNKVILYLGRTPNFLEEVKLQDDGSGPYIKEWNISSEKAKPTDAQLDALTSEATKLGNNNGVSSEHIMELIEVSKRNRVFSYDGFAAVKEAGHYGTKFS